MAKPISVDEVVAGAAETKAPESVNLAEAFRNEVAYLRTFSSGKKGYGTYGKLTLPGGIRVQCSVNLVILK